MNDFTFMEYVGITTLAFIGYILTVVLLTYLIKNRRRIKYRLKRFINQLVPKERDDYEWIDPKKVRELDGYKH